MRKIYHILGFLTKRKASAVPSQGQSLLEYTDGTESPRPGSLQDEEDDNDWDDDEDDDDWEEDDDNDDDWEDDDDDY